MDAGKVRRLLERYGQTVTVRQGETEVTAKALLQPVTDRRDEQHLPGELGLRRGDWYRYFGQAHVPLTAGPGRQVIWAGQGFRVRSAHPVYVGEQLSHWEGLLTPEGSEVP